MNLFRTIRKKEKQEKTMNEYWKLFGGYRPTFTSFEGGLYEMELTRAAIHSFATQVSKLKPEVNGPGNRELERTLQFKPNPIQCTSQYLYRMATIFMMNNNVCIAPIEDDLEKIKGYWVLLPNNIKIFPYQGKSWVEYTFSNGKKAYIEYEKIGIMNQFQYKDDFFGENNSVMRPTMEMINANNQGIINGVKASANIRFLAKLVSAEKPKDIEVKRKAFVEQNLASDNNGGVLMYGTEIEDVRPIESKPFVVNAAQVDRINENVFDYFGTNDKILQNKFTSDEWNAYYEGKIEPFAIQASLIHTNMTFAKDEIARGKDIIFTANRLQYLSNTEKLSTVTQLFDRGFLTHNQGLEIFNMAPIADGDKRYIRKEYALTDNYEEEMKKDATASGTTVQNNDSAGSATAGQQEEN